MDAFGDKTDILDIIQSSPGEAKPVLSWSLTQFESCAVQQEGRKAAPVGTLPKERS